MSVQRWEFDAGLPRSTQVLAQSSEGDWMRYSDHARIVAEMEQVHAAALLTQDQQHMEALGQIELRVWEEALTEGSRARGYERGLADAKKAVRDECYHDDGEWCIFDAAIDALIPRQRQGR